MWVANTSYGVFKGISLKNLVIQMQDCYYKKKSLYLDSLYFKNNHGCESNASKKAMRLLTEEVEKEVVNNSWQLFEVNNYKSQFPGVPL